MSVCSSRLVCTASGDFFVMKGVVEEFLEKAGMHKIIRSTIRTQDSHSLHPGTTGKYPLRRRSDWIPGRSSSTGCWIITESVKRHMLPFWTCRRSWKKLPSTANTKVLPKFPAVTRDLSMVVPKTCTGRSDRRYDHPAWRQTSGELQAL